MASLLTLKEELELERGYTAPFFILNTRFCEVHGGTTLFGSYKDAAEYMVSHAVEFQAGTFAICGAIKGE